MTKKRFFLKDNDIQLKNPIIKGCPIQMKRIIMLGLFVSFAYLSEELRNVRGTRARKEDIDSIKKRNENTIPCEFQ